jgi:hypothetical protein
MLYGKYQLMCRLESDASLPFFKGSTFRGLFGHALKKVVCALKRQACSQCLLKQRCVYALVFETSACLDLPKNSKITALPHPFVIEPPLTSETYFLKGSAFDFNLLLFGEVNRSLPYFIYAIDRMGDIGIGKKIDGKRGRFSLREVKFGRNTIYTASDQKLNASDTAQPLHLAKIKNQPDGKSRLIIFLETPLRIKFENRLKADLPFHVLIRAMLRRCASLLDCYGDGEPALDYRGLVKRAGEVIVVEADLKWFDWKRYSHRQDKSMLMGGMTGSVTYEGNISEFMPLVDFCAEVHVGKQTAFGLGKIRSERLT